MLEEDIYHHILAIVAGHMEGGAAIGIHSIRIGSQFQEEFDSMGLTSSSCRVEWSVVLLVFGVDVSSTANQGADTVTVTYRWKQE